MPRPALVHDVVLYFHNLKVLQRELIIINRITLYIN